MLLVGFCKTERIPSNRASRSYLIKLRSDWRKLGSARSNVFPSYHRLKTSACTLSNELRVPFSAASTASSYLRNHAELSSEPAGGLSHHGQGWRAQEDP